MNEASASRDPNVEKRRSTRVAQAVPAVVTGMDAFGRPFKEHTTTLTVNCHGCRYPSKHYVPKNSAVTLEIGPVETQSSPRTVLGRVAWVQRPRTIREPFQIGMEFETAGNVWEIGLPPEDWFPPSATPEGKISGVLEMSSVSETARSSAERTGTASSFPASSTDAADATAPATVIFPARTTAERPHETESSAASDPAHHSPQVALAWQLDQMIAEAKETLGKTVRREAQTAVNEEMTFVRQQIETQIHDAVERAIRISMERASEAAAKKIVQQTADRTTAIVEEWRKTADARAEELDGKLRQAVQEDLAKASEEFEAKSAETQQAARESLLMASEWQQKKAQAVIQSAMEQAVEDSGAALRAQAGEISSRLAADMDRFSRDYAAQSRANMAEAAEEVAARQRQNLAEAAEAANANVADSIHRATRESLGQFEERARQTLEQMRSDLEHACQNSLAAFLERIEDQMTQGVEHARLHLQSELAELVETWEAKREAQQRDWAERWNELADESIEQYKVRLANASNAWLLASASSLRGRSQPLLETLAQDAEKRLLEACAAALAGAGDTLRKRLFEAAANPAASGDEIAQNENA